MVFKSTKLIVSDTSGYLSSRTFHIYGKKKSLKKTGFVYASIREVYMSLRNHVGKKKRSFVVRTVKTFQRGDGSSVSYLNNSSLPLKKRLTIIGKKVKGPLSYEVKRRKLMSSFCSII